jgi:hypothetical protein
MMRRLATSGPAVFSGRARGSTETVLIRLAVAAAAGCLLYHERTKARAVARYSNNPEHRANLEYRERAKDLARARARGWPTPAGADEEVACDGTLSRPGRGTL